MQWAAGAAELLASATTLAARQRKVGPRVYGYRLADLGRR